jgi:hypothetical protein
VIAGPHSRRNGARRTARLVWINTTSLVDVNAHARHGDMTGCSANRMWCCSDWHSSMRPKVPCWTSLAADGSNPPVAPMRGLEFQRTEAGSSIRQSPPARPENMGRACRRGPQPTRFCGETCTELDCDLVAVTILAIPPRSRF